MRFERKTIRYNQSPTGWSAANMSNDDVNRYRDNYRNYFKPACERLVVTCLLEKNLKTFSGTPQVNPDPEG